MAAPIRRQSSPADVDPWAELVERVAAEVVASIRVPSLDEARAACNEVGLRKARTDVAAALAAIESAQETYRESQAVERLAREAHDQALGDAVWELGDRFQAEGNKTYLVTPCEACAGRGYVGEVGCTCVRGQGCDEEGDPGCALCQQMDGEMPCPADDCSDCDGKGSTRKPMLADDVKAWKAAEARKMPAVAEAAKALYRAEEETAAARDSVTFAGHRFSAARHDLDAACAELGALATALTVR